MNYLYRRIGFSILILTLTIPLGCRSPKSVKFPESHDDILPDMEWFTYEETSNWIKNNPDFVHDVVDTSESKFIKSADYYYVNSKKGFLILNFSDRSYIIKDFPADLWKEFKKADNFEQFYNIKIRFTRFGGLWMR